jgi:hypothetical protein
VTNLPAVNLCQHPSTFGNSVRGNFGKYASGVLHFSGVISAKSDTLTPLYHREASA